MILMNAPTIHLHAIAEKHFVETRALNDVLVLVGWKHCIIQVLCIDCIILWFSVKIAWAAGTEGAIRAHH
jgi:hypothetical protein